ncbi:hypothetical protein [Parasitella parasitica]|uniref:Uncharacterized protein n=1 Tax=Parasitella parasitica TaxID=35722 RepID=A0A0B7NAK9_9FUNG|nr:hypothetical protein [Parasitella parasitica]
MEYLKTGQSPYMQQEPSIVSSKGRPKGADLNNAYDDDNNEDNLEEAHCVADYGPLLPKYFYDISKDIDAVAYEQIINIRVFPQEKMKVSVAPLMMHIVTTRGGDKPKDCVTMKLMRSIQLKWPTIDAYHQSVMSARGRPNDIRFWQKTISFKKREQHQSEKIVNDDM